MTHQPTTVDRSCRLEQFESRTLMTAQTLLSVADFAPQAEIEALSSQTGTAWYTATAQNVRNLYGFDGRGQTIAVIDSGIAWDHYALGGGFGPGHRVVGGWDFAENDANPFDDGPAGFHGTHVAGIVGSQHAVHTGVAPGVDLVALRVFNDQGQGQMEWVRQALRWVSDHRLSFANPITAVNLSLGTDWNGTSPPGWASLETELSNLRSQGIFISVAAGNAFQQYQAVGLSYPAASSFVVPVASHGPNGTLSGFSQRLDRVLVAPGESIKSTVPNHLFGGMQSNQFLGASGTSMAAPYVAGASALLRQAYQFMGQQQVHQHQLYQTFVNSADRVYDPVTSAWYHRINLEKAVASVVVDLHGNTADSAFQIGHLHHAKVVSGTIGTRQDVDWFSFTATASGQLKIHTETTHQLRAVMQTSGGSAQWDGQTLVLNVTAGQQYKFSIKTSDGIGHYQLRAEYATSNINAISWGRLFFQEKSVSINGQQYVQLTAGNHGFLTVAAAMRSGNLNFQLFDGNMQMIASSQSSGGEVRLDAQVTRDGTYFLRVQGQGTADVRAINLVNLSGNHLTIRGTHQADLIDYRVAASHEVTIHGVRYDFNASQIRTVMIDGRGGTDSLNLKLGNQSDQVTLRPNHITVVNDQFQLRAKELRTIKVDGGGGDNALRMIGSLGSDRFFGAGLTAAMSGSGYANYAYQMASVIVNGRSGHDTVDLGNSRPLAHASAAGRRLEFARGNQFVTIFNMEHRVVPHSVYPTTLSNSLHVQSSLTPRTSLSVDTLVNVPSTFRSGSNFAVGTQSLLHSYSVRAELETTLGGLSGISTAAIETPSDHRRIEQRAQVLADLIEGALALDNATESLADLHDDLTALEALFQRLGQ